MKPIASRPSTLSPNGANPGAAATQALSVPAAASSVVSALEEKANGM